MKMKGISLRKEVASLLYNAGFDYDAGKFLYMMAAYGLGFGLAVFLIFYHFSSYIAILGGIIAAVVVEVFVYMVSSSHFKHES